MKNNRTFWAKLMIVNLIASVAILNYGCLDAGKERVVVLHAGSLSRPFLLLAEEYRSSNTGVEILLEPAGSLVTARKITELGKPCDIMGSADYQVIDNLLIPNHASWNIGFAGNEMVIAYRDGARYSDVIDKNNWYEILLRDDVGYGRADPDADPCGYRAIFTLKLAEEFYGVEGITDQILAKDNRLIRPKGIDLVALIETGAADYIFEYRSVAVQSGLRYLTLPSEINLGDYSFRSRYQSVGTMVAGSSPSERIYMPGDVIIYGITVIDDAPNRDEAVRFLSFILGERGQEVFRESGHTIPEHYPVSGHVSAIPPDILTLLNEETYDY